MEQLTALLLTKALDGLAMRSSAIAQNIANANSPGYVPIGVSFEERLKSAAAAGLDAVRALQPEFVRRLPDPAQPSGLGSADVRLDLEMETASATALRYAALVDVLGRQMQLHRIAAMGAQ